MVSESQQAARWHPFCSTGGGICSLMFSETVVVSLTQNSAIRAEVQPHVAAVDHMLKAAAEALSTRFDSGALKTGLVQGSAFCCGIFYADDPVRALVSPEELTASMAIKLLEEAPDE